MQFKLHVAVAAVACSLVGGAAVAQVNTFKVGAIYYQTHAKTNGVSGIGVPAGSDVDVGNATTLLLTYERTITPNVGVEFVFGVPPTIKANATGPLASLGEVLSTKNVAPTLLLNYHFGAPGDALRPYLGAGINYTKFVSIKSSLAPDVKMGDSTGLALQAGVDYALSKDWGLFASVAAVQVKSKVVASGATVLTTTVDFRPITYSFGALFRF
jgi:outer membrane protein